MSEPRIFIRVSPTEKTLLQDAAKKAGMDFSKWALSILRKAATNPSDIQTCAQTEPVRTESPAAAVRTPLSPKLVPLKPLSDPSQRDYSAAYQ